MIKEWILLNNCEHTFTPIYSNNVLPDTDDFDCLIILGGPMSVHNTAKFPWLLQEKMLIKKAIEANKIVVGICLGAQLIADTLGAKVYKNPQKEIGFYPMDETTISGSERNLAFKISQLLNHKTVFHWHGETFEMPENAIRLASSEACLNQAFLYKNNVLGLQFHVEMDEQAIETIIENCREELVKDDFVQPEEFITQNKSNHISENKKILFDVLDLMIIQKSKNP